MNFKVWLVTLFVLLVSEAVFALRHKRKQIPISLRSCKGILTAQNFNIKELAGSTWFVQAIVNVGDRIPASCTIGTYATSTDNKTLFHTMDYNRLEGGEYGSYKWEMKQMTSNRFVMYVLGNDKLKAHGFMAYKSENMLIISMCFQKDGSHLFQDYVVWTKKRDVDKKKIEEEVRKTKIPIRDYFDMIQDENCFKYRGKK